MIHSDLIVKNNISCMPVYTNVFRQCISDSEMMNPFIDVFVVDFVHGQEKCKISFFRNVLKTTVRIRTAKERKPDC